jgi:hypothetical protein
MHPRRDDAHDRPAGPHRERAEPPPVPVKVIGTCVGLLRASVVMGVCVFVASRVYGWLDTFFTR